MHRLSGYLADHLQELNLEDHLYYLKRQSHDHIVRVLELGASAGLPYNYTVVATKQESP